ncbi:MAG: tetratricopeptide repeat protein [Thaumarchaeota archaeon]|nr:tetratricopeptide repeat protein [Nitrososphaerota archaeon]
MEGGSPAVGSGTGSQKWEVVSRMSLEELDAVVSRDPRNANAHFFRGSLLAKAGRVQDALEAFKLAAELEPKNVEMRRAVGYTQQRLGEHEDALGTFDSILDELPGRVDVMCAKASSLAALRRVGESLEILELAITLDPYSSDAHAGRGFAQYMLRWDDDGLAALRRATALDPKNAHARAWTGLALVRHRREGEAMAEYDRALSIDSNITYPRMLKCAVLQKGRRYKEMLEEADRALVADPGNPTYRAMRALALGGLGQTGDALVEIYALISERPDFDGAPGIFGHVLVALGRYEEALGHLERAVEDNPTDVMAHSDKIVALFSLRRIEEGATALAIASELNPGAAIFYAYRGYICRRLGKHDEAQSLFERARALDPAIDIPGHEAWNHKGAGSR